MPKAEPAESAPTQCRMDFSIKVLRAVEETRYVEFEIKPDPRRYTPVMRDGEQWYLDKYLNHLIPLKEFAEKMKGLPIYCLHPSIDYAARRKNAVEQELETGAHVVPLDRIGRSSFLHEPLRRHRRLRFIVAHPLAGIDQPGAEKRRAAVRSYSRALRTRNTLRAQGATTPGF
jgi:hypothetical protein